jgi:uncharacterized protein YndB with AHSA1/START domain
MSANTIRLHRVLRATPEKVYRAFLDGDAMSKWLPPNGFTGKVHHMDAKVGGTYKMSFTNFSTGKSHSFGGEYLELVAHERIRYTDRFDDPNLPGEIHTTITLKKVSCGTELNIEQEGVPAVIPAEACYVGWQESLNLLAKLVEPEIPDSEATVNTAPNSYVLSSSAGARIHSFNCRRGTWTLRMSKLKTDPDFVFGPCSSMGVIQTAVSQCC